MVGCPAQEFLAAVLNARGKGGLSHSGQQKPLAQPKQDEANLKVEAAKYKLAKPPRQHEKENDIWLVLDAKATHIGVAVWTSSALEVWHFDEEGVHRDDRDYNWEFAGISSKEFDVPQEVAEKVFNRVQHEFTAASYDSGGHDCRHFVNRLLEQFCSYEEQTETPAGGGGDLDCLARAMGHDPEDQLRQVRGKQVGIAHKGSRLQLPYTPFTLHMLHSQLPAPSS